MPYQKSKPSTAKLLEVARIANVSPSTVSRFLNGTAKIGEDKRKAVEAAIKELNFKPNLAARSLKTGKTMTIGVLTQAIDSPFFSINMLGIEAGLANSGYAPIIVSGHWDAQEELERIHLLMSRQIDGLIILTGHLSSEHIIELARQVPIVVTGRDIESEHLISTHINQEQCGYLATQHLIDLGHRRIAHIAGPLDNPDAQARLAGYRRALVQADLKWNAKLVAQGTFKELGGTLATDHLLASKQTFSAIFAANDQTAFGARISLHRHGLSVPNDMSLIGVDDLPAAAYSIPPLSTVNNSTYEIGIYAAQSLLRLLGHEVAEVSAPQVYLVQRESTAAF